MTTEPVATASHPAALVLMGLVMLIGLSCSAGVSNRNADHIDTSGYPPEIQDAYRVFAVRCSRCHTLARPLNARIQDDRHWLRYVARMRRQPGSGINHANADVILRFLLFHAAQLRAEERGLDEPVLPANESVPAVTLPKASIPQQTRSEPATRAIHREIDPLPSELSTPSNPAPDAGAGREK